MHQPHPNMEPYTSAALPKPVHWMIHHPTQLKLHPTQQTSAASSTHATLTIPVPTVNTYVHFCHAETRSAPHHPIQLPSGRLQATNLPGTPDA
jgi:hypothetical protein